MSDEYYQALLNKDSEYEGVFFVGVTSTGIFCRPSCPARKPKRENCEFFASVEEALLAGFRPCKRCTPLALPKEESTLIQKLVQAVEEDPEHRWCDQDLRNRQIDPSTARRQFKKRFGMTFVAYARARRMGLALSQVRRGNRVIDAQLESGYESGSGFRDAFARIMGAPPSRSRAVSVLYARWIDTPLGPMIAMADEEHLHLLEFADRRGLEREVERMRTRRRCTIIPGNTAPLDSISEDLTRYFAGESLHFETPFTTQGTPFQEKVWQELQRIPPGETRSYQELAQAVANPKGYRAVARANGTNQLALIIPCHRVINASGELGGYAGGLRRKEWLLEHERAHSDAPADC